MSTSSKHTLTSNEFPHDLVRSVNLHWWQAGFRLPYVVAFKLSSIAAVEGMQERSAGQVGPEKRPEKVLGEAPHCQDAAQT